ncbi:MAG TPA: DUF302 domain-containing protein [Polyangiaceae bacterium]|jgi:uncharacterized protein (DUF302 family)|nr:DUF302 domain-containing protein [Polyangiaceae bacterium]
MEGLTTLASHFTPEETLRRLEAEIAARGMAVLAKIDHAAGAASVGLALRPTVVVLFGNAKAGTPLMQQSQLMGIDLPLKVLVWRDAEDRTWLSYVDPHWLAKRHGLGSNTDATTNTMTATLGAVARTATTSG